MVAGLAGQVEELFPWDLLDEQENGETPLLLDIRGPHEIDAARIAGSVNVPRGIALDADLDNLDAGRNFAINSRSILRVI